MNNFDLSSKGKIDLTSLQRARLSLSLLLRIILANREDEIALANLRRARKATTNLH